MDAWRTLFADAGATAPERERPPARSAARGARGARLRRELRRAGDGSRHRSRRRARGVPRRRREATASSASSSRRARGARSTPRPPLRRTPASPGWRFGAGAGRARHRARAAPSSTPSRRRASSVSGRARTTAAPRRRRRAWAPRPPSATARPRGPERRERSLWRGRTFALARTLDPNTGLSADELRVTREDGSRIALRLPGEACGPSGRFGRPHYRMSADGRSGLDLRFVDGGCHAVRIDLETGDWQKLDAASAPRNCATARRIPAANLSVALRGYMREVESALVEGGADPAAAFVLEIDEDGETTARARDFSGGQLSSARAALPAHDPAPTHRRLDGRARAPRGTGRALVAADARAALGPSTPPQPGGPPGAEHDGRHSRPRALALCRLMRGAPAAPGALARGLPQPAHPD